ncbi:MAG: hypothetical protein KGZ83_19855 [Sulfuricella sp.]|nr:hypothetical protein [Sulfuricella sp.]
MTGSIQDEAASSHPIAPASPLVGVLPKRASLRKPVLPKSHAQKKPLEKVARKKRKLCWRDGELGVCP